MEVNVILFNQLIIVAARLLTEYEQLWVLLLAMICL